jgi:hypothetical protein
VPPTCVTGDKGQIKKEEKNVVAKHFQRRIVPLHMPRNFRHKGGKKK